MLGYETHGTSFSDETMAKPMSHGLRDFVPSVNPCWPLLVVFFFVLQIWVGYFLKFFETTQNININILSMGAN
jgi:hypothetical protein